MEITIKWNVDSKSDEEAKKKVMKLLKNAQGTLLTPLPDWDPEELRTEIQDLKLENDRLRQRVEIMLPFVLSAKCSGISCSNCMFFDDKYPIGRKCVFNRDGIFAEILKNAAEIVKKLEDL